VVILGVLLGACAAPEAEQQAAPEPTVAEAPEPDIRGEEVAYQAGDVQLNGYLAYDAAQSGERPGVLVVHEWWGHNDYARQRARMLAEMGYTALAVDMYGDGKLAEHPEDAQKFMMEVIGQMDVGVARFRAARAVLEQHATTDPSRTAAIGYCFGGATVMQMAYAGADLDGVVSFHGPLPPANEEQQKKINTSILVAHGEADSFVPADRLAAFKEGLEKSGADWQMVTYGGARHAFTDPAADRRGNENLKYDEKADQRSWALMQSFFEEIFAD
jgi:dienelactone hydrolase